MSLPPITPAGKTIRFAVFEVDLAAGELRKNGSRIRLQEQPFQILVYLLDRPGEVVTREELRQKLWPADTFVDFDHSLNTAINKLREALGDSASSPRYVETLARRGYRFLAPVQRAEPKLPDLCTVPTVSRTEASFHRDLEVPFPRRGLTRGLFGLIQLMYLIFYLSALFRLSAIDRITSGFLPGWGARAIFIAVLVTAGVGIPLRCYLISAAAFDHRSLGQKFRRMFPGHTGAGPTVGCGPISSRLRGLVLGRPLRPRQLSCTCRFRRERWCGWRIPRRSPESCSRKPHIAV